MLLLKKDSESANETSLEMPFVLSDLDPEQSRKMRIENEFGADFKTLIG